MAYTILGDHNRFYECNSGGQNIQVVALVFNDDFQTLVNVNSDNLSIGISSHVGKNVCPYTVASHLMRDSLGLKYGYPIVTHVSGINGNSSKYIFIPSERNYDTTGLDDATFISYRELFPFLTASDIPRETKELANLIVNQQYFFRTMLGLK